MQLKIWITVWFVAIIPIITSNLECYEEHQSIDTNILLKTKIKTYQW